MPQKKQRRRRTKSSTKTVKRHFHLGLAGIKWIIGLSLIFALVAGSYSLYLSKTVRVKFEGKRWSVPARVYARPLELYVGATVGKDQLRHELQVLGYRKAAQPRNSAQWSEKNGRFTVYTRAFRFWDKAQQAQKVSIRISNGQVTHIQTADSARELDLFRLEPAEIGSIYPSHNEDRILVGYQEIPQHLINGLLAVEDKRFFEHAGVDPKGIARAVWANIRAGKTVQGGSTLTQQLVKNFILTPERSLKRKLNEAWMALIVEAKYDKEEILEAYANEIFLGQDGARAIHGFGLASYHYFNRPLRELRLHEAALLVGLVKGASYYNPRKHPERAKKRRNLVLQAMADQGFIEQSDVKWASALALGVTQIKGSKGHRYPAFIDLVRRQLRQDYREEDLTSEGLRIFSTLDPWDQHIATKTLEKQLPYLEKSKKLPGNRLQAALVVSSPQNGEVLALLGSRVGKGGGFNRALDAVRPIGSLAKPAVYLTALQRPEQYSLSSFLRDEAVTLRQADGSAWTPQNFDRKVHGKVMLYDALAKSLNLATVNLGMELGVKNVSQTMRNLGVSSKINNYPSTLLGAVSLSPFEVTQMYQTLAAEGFKSPLRAIREVLDAYDEPLHRYPLVVTRVAKQGSVYLLSYALVHTTQSGTAKSLKYWLPETQVAGKTGTTNDLRDSWFAGYSGDRVAVAWIGRDDNKPTGLTGSSGALTLWGRYMRDRHTQALALVPPADIKDYWVELDTGALAAESCKNVARFPYVAGYKPGLKSGCAELDSIQSMIEKFIYQ